MTSNVLRHPVHSLLLAMVLTSFCNGQHKDKSDQINRPEIFSSATQPKLVKSQGSNEHDNVHAMLQDGHGDLWFATTGEGVYRYDGKVFMQFTQKDGLKSNTVYSMLEDSSGNIWFGTKKGISRFDGKSISSVSISDANGKNFLSLLNTSNSPADMNEVSSIMQDMKIMQAKSGLALETLAYIGLMDLALLLFPISFGAGNFEFFTLQFAARRLPTNSGTHRYANVRTLGLAEVLFAQIVSRRVFPKGRRNGNLPELP